MKRFSIRTILIATTLVAIPFACFTFVDVEIKTGRGIEAAEDYVVFDKGGWKRASSAYPWTTVKHYDPETGRAIIRTQRITALFLDYDSSYTIQPREYRLGDPSRLSP